MKIANIIEAKSAKATSDCAADNKVRQ